MAETPSGASIGLIVFGYEEGITCLEIYYYDNGPAKLPRLECVRSYDSPRPTDAAAGPVAAAKADPSLKRSANVRRHTDFPRFKSKVSSPLHAFGAA